MFSLCLVHREPRVDRRAERRLGAGVALVVELAEQLAQETLGLVFGGGGSGQVVRPPGDRIDAVVYPDLIGAPALPNAALRASFGGGLGHGQSLPMDSLMEKIILSSCLRWLEAPESLAWSVVRHQGLEPRIR